MAKDIFDDKSEDNSTDEQIIKNEDGSFIVGGKQFVDVDALINSKVHADKHISTLLNEKKTVESKLEKSEEAFIKATSLEGKLDYLIQANQSADLLEENDLGGNMDQKSVTSQNPDLSAVIQDAVSQAVKPFADKLNQYEEAATLNDFSAEVTSHYESFDKGKDALTKFAEQAQLTQEQVKNMAQVNPASTLELLKMTVPKGNSAPTGKQVSSDITVPGSGIPGGERPGTDASHKPTVGYKELYDKLKHRPGSWKVEDQAMMNEGVEKLGSEYFTT